MEKKSLKMPTYYFYKNDTIRRVPESFHIRRSHLRWITFETYIIKRNFERIIKRNLIFFIGFNNGIAWKIFVFQVYTSNVFVSERFVYIHGETCKYWEDKIRHRILCNSYVKRGIIRHEVTYIGLNQICAPNLVDVLSWSFLYSPIYNCACQKESEGNATKDWSQNIWILNDVRFRWV